MSCARHRRHFVKYANARIYAQREAQSTANNKYDSIGIHGALAQLMVGAIVLHTSIVVMLHSVHLVGANCCHILSALQTVLRCRSFQHWNREPNPRKCHRSCQREWQAQSNFNNHTVLWWRMGESLHPPANAVVSDICAGIAHVFPAATHTHTPRLSQIFCISHPRSHPATPNTTNSNR